MARFEQGLPVSESRNMLDLAVGVHANHARENAPTRTGELALSGSGGSKQNAEESRLKLSQFLSVRLRPLISSPVSTVKRRKLLNR